MMESRFLNGGGGLRLHLAATGPVSAPPILFLHGWSQSHLSWRKQFAGALAQRFRLLALDLRGHGMSDKPDGFAPYQDGALWAADVAAAVAFCDAPPLVVAWSYAGLVLGDYLRRNSDGGLAGFMLVSALLSQGQSRPPPGPDTDSPIYSGDLGTSIAAMRNFVTRCCAAPLSPDELAEMTAMNVVVPGHVRLGANMRQEDYAPDYARSLCPARIIIGSEDTLVGRAESDAALAAMPRVRRIEYEGVGHMPFYEAPERFDSDLADLAAEVFSDGEVVK